MRAGTYKTGNRDNPSPRGERDIDDELTRRLWLYSAGLSDERPRPLKKIRQKTDKDQQKVKVNSRRGIQREIGDMTFFTLMKYYYSAGGTGRNWVFPI